jgi:hypothetical protein
MTEHSFSATEAVPQRMMPAWLFSLAFHSSAIVLLGLSIRPEPLGGTNEMGGSADIVLNTTSAEVDLYDDENGESDAAAIAEQSPPVDLLSVLPDTAAGITETLPPRSPLMQTASVSQHASGQSPPLSSRHVSPGGHSDATVSVFGVQGEGSKFVYLFDRSSSMEGAPLAAAKRQLLESLTSLDAEHQFHIIFFNTKIQPLEIARAGRRLPFATDRHKQLAANFVGGVTADGGTDRLTALKQAIAFAPHVIFFLTDADDPMSPGELAEIARDNGRSRAAICVIEFGRRQSPLPGNFLVELAHQSGGQYGYVNTLTLSGARP